MTHAEFMTQAAFRFVEDPHGYFLGQQELMSPSSVFAELGLVDPRFYTPQGRSRGRAVHAALHIILGQHLTVEQFLATYELHPDLHGYVRSGYAWIERRAPKILRLETSAHHPVLPFAGTWDVEWELDRWPWIIDWKTGKAAKVTRYQTASYAMLAARPVGGRPHKRAALELQEDGSIANLVTYEDYTDGAAWLNLLGAALVRRALKAPQLAPLPQGD